MVHETAAVRRNCSKRAFAWDWVIPEPSTEGHPRSPLSFHVAEQLAGAPFSNGLAAGKFNSFWTIELREGWSLFAMHPANRSELPFRLLTGVVDWDRFYDAGINFLATAAQGPAISPIAVAEIRTATADGARQAWYPLVYDLGWTIRMSKLTRAARRSRHPAAIAGSYRLPMKTSHRKRWFAQHGVLRGQ
ncbi:hypothetical protein [Rhizobium hidalgonense]|uniref:hypothetical protein n=1 Tax=Rhizobium hidalgonense TaxID=1538159 RepID=UPI0019D4E146|nr:hypothetical protein [Rhizobium hidalgonense]